MTATHDLPVAAACRCASLSRSAYYNEPDHWTVRDAEFIAELVADRPSRGFWKCYKIIRRRGYDWNHKRVYRVYIAMGLNRRRPAKRRLPKRERVALYVPRMCNDPVIFCSGDTTQRKHT